jgi:hypothetical protein
VLRAERDKDAAPHPRTRRTAAQLYKTVENTVQRVVNNHWHLALGRKHATDGESVAHFRKRWVAPGLTIINKDGGCTLTLFMHDAQRARWHRPRPDGEPARFRTQQYAPPSPLPANTIELFCAGDGDPRKKNEPPPPAGYGVVASDASSQMFTICGQITTATPAVKTITENLACLVAFKAACDWAATDPVARDRPVCLRYSTEYAAMVATGTWKAKKHKDMAAAAKRAWATLRKMKPGDQVWLRHTKPHGTATELAARGKQGETVYAATHD